MTDHPTSASACGRRSWPEIRRGSRVSWRVARVWACSSFSTKRSNSGAATATAIKVNKQPIHGRKTCAARAKTRQERADFLRRFFRGLHDRAGLKTLPDPRNLAHKHIRAMMQVWRDDKLKPPTIQTYLSFLRGLAVWTGKPGFVRGPACYGLELDEYQRHEAAERDKSWPAQGIDNSAASRLARSLSARAQSVFLMSSMMGRPCREGVAADPMIASP